MQTAQRVRAFLQVLLAVGFACGAASAQEESNRCRMDALDKWYCSADPRGSAVVDELGRIACAPGACAKTDEEGWVCSSVPGGKASVSPEGPVCDGQCRPPEVTDCEKI